MVEVLHDHALRHLQLQILRAASHVLDGQADRFDQPLMPEMGRRQVHGHSNGRQAGLLPGLLLATGGPDHPFTDRNRQSGLFGAGEELCRPEQPARGMAPSQKGLDSPDGPPFDVYLWLIVQNEFIVLDRTAQVGFEPQTLGLVGTQLFGEIDKAGAAFGLGALESGIGLLEQGRDVSGIGGEERDADAGGEGDVLLSDQKRLLDRGEQSAGQLGCVPRSSKVRHQDGKGIGDQTRKGVGREMVIESGKTVALADTILEAVGDGMEHLVPGHQSHRLVDPAEVIQVEHKYRAWLAALLRRLQGLSEPFFEQEAVRQIGEPIVKGGEEHLRFRVAPNRDVLDGAGDGQHVPLLVAGGRPPFSHDPFFSAGADDPVIHFIILAQRQGFLQ